ncbi:MAG: IS21 family transposase [Candidatus Acidiferrales bacterium]
MELYEQIRREYEHGAGTIRAVARKLGVHRREVRKALARALPADRRIPERERPKLARAIPFIDGILESGRKAPRKQRHTARRIWNRLRHEMPEVDAAESTVRQYVRQRKAAMGLLGQETFVPRSYTWGGEAQVDWYEGWAEFDGEARKMNLFCLRSMASGGAFHRAYPHANQQAFLEAHELASAYFGGVFRVPRYDNLKSAVKKILRGHQREETARFIAFRSHWGFESEFRTPGEGHEKGGVEGEGGQFRRNYPVPVPKAGSLEELNRLPAAGSKEDDSRAIEGRAQSVGAGMIVERGHLLPLAEEGFDLASLHFPTVNGSGCVKALTNLYPAPWPVGTTVEVKVYSAYVEIWYQAKCVARHERCYERHRKVLELEHYLDVPTKKPGALAGSTALEQCRSQGRWPASYDQFWEVLRQRQGKQEGTRAMIDVLLLAREHGPARVRQAVEEALELGCSDVGAVRYLLSVSGQEQSPPAAPVHIGALNRYDRPQPSLADYEQLRPHWVAKEVIQ